MRMTVFALVVIAIAAAVWSAQSLGTGHKAEAASSVFSVNKLSVRTELDGRPFQVVGVRTANALVSDAATNELIANMDTFKAYGINTFSVFFQGARFGDIKGFNEDTTLNPTYAARLARIIQEANSRDMVVLVGLLYYGGSKAKWASWGQNEANQAVANAVRWLRDNNFRNVFIDVNNEHMAPFNDSQLIAAGKAVDSGFVMGSSGRDTPSNADVSLHFGATNIPGKPYIESEGTPVDYWGSWSRNSSEYNYSNIGVYTNSMKDDWKQRTSNVLNSGKGYIGASTWLQSVPPRGPNHRPGGYGTESDPGIRFWLEHVQNIVRPGSPGVTPIPTATTAPGTPAVPGSPRFVLYDAKTDQPIAKHDPLEDGAVIDLQEAREINIVFVTPLAGVGSVRFSLNGNNSFQVENSAPFALAGDASGGTDLLAWTPAVGTYTLTATPYPGPFALGSPGEPSTIRFTVVSGNAGAPPAANTPTPTATPSPTPNPFNVTRVGDWGYEATHPTGIQHPVVMRTFNPAGDLIYVIYERSAPYCAFGNHPGHSCSHPQLIRGVYTVEAVITANNGTQITVRHDVLVD